MSMMRLAENNVALPGPWYADVAPQSAQATPCPAGLGSTLSPGVDMVDLVAYPGSWSGSTPVFSKSLGTARAAKISKDRFLWVNKGTGYVKTWGYRSLADLTSLGSEGDWFADGTTGTFYVNSTITHPTAKGWKIYEHESMVESTPYETHRRLWRTRYIEHPTLGGFEYPHNPKRTFGYYRSSLRTFDVNSAQTFGSAMNVRDFRNFDDIVVTEVWSASTVNELSMLSEFFDALQLMRMTEIPIGSYMTWIPKDLGYNRHKILPIFLGVGDSENDVHEVRERFSTSIDSYLDQTVKFSFRLARPPRLIDSFIKGDGW